MSIDAIQAATAFVSSSSQATPAPQRRQESAPAVESASSRVAPNLPAPRALPQARQFQVSASYGSGHLVIYRILDKETGDLIQQIPPEQFLQAASENREPAPGAAGNPKLDLNF